MIFKPLFLLSLIVTIVFLATPTLYEYDLGNSFVAQQRADPINQFFVVKKDSGLKNAESETKQGSNGQFHAFTLKRDNETVVTWRVFSSSSRGLAFLRNNTPCKIVYSGTDLFNADLEVERLELFPALNPKMFYLRMLNREEEVVWHGLIILDT